MFRFNMQTLLEARRAKEEKKQTELAEAMRELQSQKEVLDGIRNRKAQMIGEYYELKDKPVDGLRVALYNANIVRCRDMEIAQEELCRNAEKSVNEKRMALIEASKEKKVLEKLRERKAMEYQFDENQKENRELDESAILRYGGNPS